MCPPTDLISHCYINLLRNFSLPRIWRVYVELADSCFMKLSHYPCNCSYATNNVPILLYLQVISIYFKFLIFNFSVVLFFSQYHVYYILKFKPNSVIWKYFFVYICLDRVRLLIQLSRDSLSIRPWLITINMQATGYLMITNEYLFTSEVKKSGGIFNGFLQSLQKRKYFFPFKCN